MSLKSLRRLAGLACFSLIALAGPAPAAESYDNCKGFIDVLPATISTQGVWCMRTDLATNLASGNAITVATNNVTIDCNDFKMGNLSAGESNGATGISAFLRQNITVRGCNVRGFYIGISLLGSGHVVEYNRVEAGGNLGVQVNGDGSVVRGNRVFDTGNPTNGAYAAISVGGLTDVLDNIISGVTTVPGSDAGVMGIFVDGNLGGRVQGNAIRGLIADGVGTPYGIFVNHTGGGLSVSRNQLVNNGAAGGNGIQCAGAPPSIVSDNHALGFTAVFSVNCTDAGGNVGN